MLLTTAWFYLYPKSELLFDDIVSLCDDMMNAHEG